MDKEQLEYLFIMLMMLICASYFMFEAYLDLNRPKFGHTTGIVVVSGICLSAIIWRIARSMDSVDFIMDDMRFDADVFFYLILPLIVFPSGYNMRRKKFFANIGTIMKFGFVGTIFCFSIYTGMTYAALKQGWFTKFDVET